MVGEGQCRFAYYNSGINKVGMMGEIGKKCQAGVQKMSGMDPTSCYKKCNMV